MNASCACRRGDVGAIVDQEFCFRARGDRRRRPREFIQHADVQFLFADLNEIYLGGNGRAHKLKNRGELVTGRRGRGCRLPVGYEVNQKLALRCERHRCLWSRLVRYRPVGHEQSA